MNHRYLNSVRHDDQRRILFLFVIPAKAGIQFLALQKALDPGFRQDDGYPESAI
jgi:hypothetical protein